MRVRSRAARRGWHGCGVVALGLWLGQSLAAAREPGVEELRLPRIAFRGPSTLVLGREKVVLSSDRDLARLLVRLEALVESAARQSSELQRQRAQLLVRKDPRDMTVRELRLLHQHPAGALTRKDQRALAEMARLARRAPTMPGTAEREKLLRQLVEVALAVRNNHRSPAPEYLDFLQVPFLLADYLHNPVGKGRKPAANLPCAALEDCQRGAGQTSGAARCLGGRARFSTGFPAARPAPAWRGRSARPPSATAGQPGSKPQPGGTGGTPVPASSYWRQPLAIADQDLYAGFGRTNLPRLEDRVWHYTAPKRSGWNPGFTLTSGDATIKVKFGEAHSEPFTSRIFHALGYHVDATDFAPWVKVKYDRRLLREFNLRREVSMQAGLGFVPLARFGLQRYWDPFDFIHHAVFKDGRTVCGARLKSLLLKQPTRPRAVDFPDNFRREVEEQLDYLVTTKANVQIGGEDARNLGPWEFGGLGREHLRELRGAGLLAAWLAWWDARFENTRLRLTPTPEGARLVHVFSDLGGGLGRANGAFRHSSETPNDLGWTFTRRRADSPGARGREEQARGVVHCAVRSRRSFQIVGYQPVEDTPAFKEMTLDDARWMGRLIGQLTEQQIVAALIASGFEAAEVRLYTEKLVSRRDQMIRDLGLADEIGLLRSNGVNRRFSYDPSLDGPVTLGWGDGREIHARTGNLIVQEGRITARQTPPGR